MSGRPLRLFVALYPPEEVRRGMVDSLEAVSPCPKSECRVVPVGQVHMTVQFIGETSERELDEVVESVRRSAAGLGSFSLQPKRLITLPERGFPRLIAVETDAHPALLEAHRRLAQRLARSPRAKSADRFLPHLTVCRFAGTARAERVDHPLSLPPFEVRAISLVKSVLRPTGAVHAVVAEATL